MVSRLPPTIISEKASQGRIHKCFYQLPPTADSLKKTGLLLLPIIEFIYKFNHTVL